MTRREVVQLAGGNSRWDLWTIVLVKMRVLFLSWVSGEVYGGEVLKRSVWPID